MKASTHRKDELSLNSSELEDVSLSETRAKHPFQAVQRDMQQTHKCAQREESTTETEDKNNNRIPSTSNIQDVFAFTVCSGSLLTILRQLVFRVSPKCLQDSKGLVKEKRLTREECNSKIAQLHIQRTSMCLLL